MYDDDTYTADENVLPPNHLDHPEINNLPLTEEDETSEVPF